MGNSSAMNIFVHVFGEHTGARCSWVCTWRGILGCEFLQNKCLSLGNTTGVCIHHSHQQSGGAQLLHISTDASNVSLPLFNQFKEGTAVLQKFWFSLHFPNEKLH